MSRLTAVCSLLITTLIFHTSLGFTQVPKPPPVAKKGILDLRGQSFKENLALNGQWIFYWNELVSPRDSSKKTSTLVDFPYRWDGKKWNGKTLPSFGFATYKLTVLLDKNAPPLRLEMPDAYSSFNLFINGDLVLSNGKVAANAKDYIPRWEFKFINIPPHTGKIDLLLQIANFSHRKGGISKPVMLGNKELIGLARRRVEAIDLLLTGCLFMGGLFFLGLYLLGNRDKAILLFSLYCIFYCYRIVGVDNYVLHTILPDVSWYITIKLEYISLFVGIGLFGLYTRYLYPDDIDMIIVKVISGICILFSVGVLVLPPLYFTQLMNPFLFVAIFCLFYIPYVYTKAYKKRRPGSVYALVSAIALMAVFSITLLNYWGFMGRVRLVNFVGYVSFFFLQSLVLSHRVSFLLTKSKEEAELGLKSKTQFLSTMSHEIRTPLNAVIGMSHLLLKNNPREDQMKHLDVMLFSANNLLAIVNDVLDYSKIEAGKIAFEHIEMDVAAIARNIVAGLQSAAQDKGIQMWLEVDKELANKVMGDPTRLFQVISNLTHNAIKFTPAGYVRIGIHVLEESETTTTLKFQVKDTGIGIAIEQQQKIFERFTQEDSSTSRGFGGTGLGLAICKKILELQNCTLELISEKGAGANFFFVQTFEKSIKTANQQILENNLPKQTDKPFEGIGILIVEDNAMNVLVAQNFLERWGATIDVAVNGLEALDKLDLKRHKLILMDLHMPLMDGYHAAAKMRADGVTIPIVALTANLPHEIADRVKQAGMDDIIVKPFLPDELFRKLLTYLYGR